MPGCGRPAITVVADTVANASRDLGFTFCPVGGGACTTFALDDDNPDQPWHVVSADPARVA